jgi:hypothetical protein
VLPEPERIGSQELLNRSVAVGAYLSSSKIGDRIQADNDVVASEAKPVPQPVAIQSNKSSVSSPQESSVADDEEDEI